MDSCLRNNHILISTFDFDGTLFRGDSLWDFPAYMFGKCHTLTAVLASLPDLARWKFGRISNSQAKERLFSRLFKGLPLIKVKDAATAYINRINSRLRRDIFYELTDSLRRDDFTFIISASPSLWLTPWVEHVEEKYRGKIILLSTEAETDSTGLLTGNFANENCHGYEKLRRLTSWLKAQTPPISLSNCHLSAWGDSNGDTALLTAANTPHRL